jgi:hypothetical protein
MYAGDIKPFIYLRKTDNVFCFFVQYIPCKELNVGENFKKNYGKSLFKFSSCSHPEIWEFQGVTASRSCHEVLNELNAEVLLSTLKSCINTKLQNRHAQTNLLYRGG